MAIECGFFNSINGDRKYDADDFAKYFSTYFTDGILMYPSSNFQVLANGDMTVTVKIGMGTIKGRYIRNTEDMVKTIDIGHTLLNRIDRAVLRFSRSARECTCEVVKGTESAIPVPTEPIRTDETFELVLADIYVPKACTKITQENITDMRQSNLCGYSLPVTRIDTATLFNQFTDQFNNWFGTIKGKLTEDQAGNLLTMINESNKKIELMDKEIIRPSKPAFEWSGKIQINTDYRINHNLGRIPIFTFSTTIGNVNPTIEMQENSFRLYTYGRSGVYAWNECSVTVRCW